MESLSKILWLIPGLPLLGFVINGLFGKRLGKSAVGTLACLLPILSFAISIAAFQDVRASHRPAHDYFNWILAGDVSIRMGLQVDHLTAVMLLVVTGVGSAIHVYSIGYMHDDEGFARFFAYLNLFMFAMLILVLADNLLLMFVGWEGVGLCSYLLIGFWYQDHKNADAGRKAFITNRAGDFGFLLGMFALFALAGSLDFDTMALEVGRRKVESIVHSGPFSGWTVQSVLNFSAGCLFIGATGKSAQIPLYVWLPDAMAGPTPVSALIHAATMVTAGVYMIGRLGFVYTLTPDVMQNIALIAAATALLTAVIACAQNDIKKVLAYSTISQLGFMFAGMATTRFETGIFHLVTHAFFKALLFLGAGAVIHALGNEQDIRKMGGLAKPMRLLFLVFAAGALALMGCPFFAGFYSKDAILTAVAYKGFDAVWAMLLLTAFLTAFYTTRLLVVVFFGAPADEEKHHHLHKPGLTMMIPLVLLAILSVGGGFLLEHPMSEWMLAANFDEARFHHAHHQSELGSFAAFGAGFVLGVVLYAFRRDWVKTFVEGSGKGLHWLVSNKFFVDEIYEYLIIAPIKMGASVGWFLIDRILIDTILVGGSAKVVYAVGGLVRRTQTGSVNTAAAGMILGALAILVYLLWGMLSHVG